ncbi:MAG: Wadjet anti-phage system protein JetA family protein [Clostridium sp.]
MPFYLHSRMIRAANISLLKTALVNTRKLNKTLQDMLHNMDKFFASLSGAETLWGSVKGTSGRLCRRDRAEKISYFKDLR